MHGTRRLLALSTAALLLTACAGETLLTAGSAPGAGGVVATGTTPDQPAFNPFGEAGTVVSGGREVIANPTIADVMHPGPLPERSLGRADAPVTIVKYASLTCQFCRQFHLTTFPQLKREYIDTGKVRFIWREFPIGMQSGQATIAWRCAPADKQLVLYEKFLSQQAQWVSQEVRLEPIARVAAQAGMTQAQLDACRADKAMVTGLVQVKDRGRTLGIIGTPNFFINGRLVKSQLDMAGLKAIIDPILAGKVAAAPAPAR